MSLVLAEEVLVQAKLCCNKDLKRDLLYIAINHAKEALLNNDVVLQELEKCERIHKSLPATEELRIATKDILRQEFNYSTCKTHTYTIFPPSTSIKFVVD